jgi:hypothetical protein
MTSVRDAMKVTKESYKAATSQMAANSSEICAVARGK